MLGSADHKPLPAKRKKIKKKEKKVHEITSQSKSLTPLSPFFIPLFVSSTSSPPLESPKSVARKEVFPTTTKLPPTPPPSWGFFFLTVLFAQLNQLFLAFDGVGRMSPTQLRGGARAWSEALFFKLSLRGDGAPRANSRSGSGHLRRIESGFGLMVCGSWQIALAGSGM